jgi:hypothetical protein
LITASSPWEFNDNDASLVSPDGKNKIRYVDLQEVQAGRESPLRGIGMLECGLGEINIGNTCGCPPIWSDNSRYLAIPVWHYVLSQEQPTIDMENSDMNYVLRQELAIIDLEKLEMKTVKDQFRVIHLKSFHGTILTGEDSPIYQTRIFKLDIDKIEYSITRKI